jgi:glucokinase
MGAATRHVGLDLGGTSIKAGALSREGRILARASAPTELEQGAGRVLDALAGLARELAGDEPLRALGLGTPGLVDRERGLVSASPNLGPLVGVPLRDGLAERLGLAPSLVRIENDANAAAFGEERLGAGRRLGDLCLVTLGTGVGGGLVLGGALWVGPGGLGGEIGHLVIEPEGRPCPCGNAGCLEQYASATAALRRAREAGLAGSLESLAGAARERPGPERRLFEEIGQDLGRGLGLVVTLLDLRIFVVGGGFGAALDVLLPGVRRGLERTVFGERRSSIRVVPAELGADAGWIGAALLGAEALGGRTEGDARG